MLTGLPLHPLVVHGAIALIPLAALGAIAISLVPSWSRRFGILVWPLALVGTGLALFAEETGESLEDIVGDPGRHAELGELVKFPAFGIAALAAVLWWIDTHSTGRRSAGTKLIALGLMLASVAGIVTVVLAGHSGAQEVWGDVVSDGRPGSLAR